MKKTELKSHYLIPRCLLRTLEAMVAFVGVFGVGYGAAHENLEAAVESLALLICAVPILQGAIAVFDIADSVRRTEAAATGDRNVGGDLRRLLSTAEDIRAIASGSPAFVLDYARRTRGRAGFPEGEHTIGREPATALAYASMSSASHFRWAKPPLLATLTPQAPMPGASSALGSPLANPRLRLTAKPTPNTKTSSEL